MDNFNDDEDKINFLEALCKTYSNFPKEPNSIQIMPIPENINDISATKKNDIYLFIFEMLLEFYIEGIMHYKDITDILVAKTLHNYDNLNFNDIESRFINEEYDNFDINDISTNILEINKDYIASIGYYLIVNEYDEDYTPDNYYCKIILKNNPSDYGYFYMRNITKPYHVILSGNFDNNKINTIKDIKCVTKINNKTFLISFDELSNILANVNNHSCRN